jgi:hypothetical protein
MCITIYALLIKAALVQHLVVIAEADPQERVLPFDIEEHEALDVDEDRPPEPAHQHVVGSELSVDEPVHRARAHGGGQSPDDVLHAAAYGPESAATSPAEVTTAAITDVTAKKIRRRGVLGGLINEYERAA